MEWISVAERLPEIVEHGSFYGSGSRPVLVTDGETYACAYRTRGFIDAVTKKPYLEWVPTGVGHSGEEKWVDFDPTHWMPIPTKPDQPTK